MGNSYGGWFPPGAPRKEGTTLIELNIKNLSDAHDIVGERPGDGAFTPVTLVPRNSMGGCCGLCCYVAIPSGFSAIVSKFGAVVPYKGAEEVTWPPGCHCFSPLLSVDKLVSKQLIIFDTPGRDVKTKDRITVAIDVMIVLEITQAPDFVYSIGPEKFDDLLRASQDEALRSMANETDVADIYDLHGRNTEAIVAEMNTKFEKYGVFIHHFTVKNVRIPQEMAQDFEEKTLFDARTTMKHMKQESDRLKLNNDEGKQKLREECDNARMAAEQQAQVVKVHAVKETSEVVAQTQKDIAELEAQWDIQKQQILTDADLEISKLRSQILSIEREIKSRTSADCGKLDAEAQAYQKQKQADAKVACAEKLANGKRALGEAEGFAANAFEARRQHQADMARLQILEKLVHNKGIQIATSQENHVNLNEENQVVTQVAQQGLEALRAKLAEITATSLAKLEQTKPGQQAMRASVAK